MLIFFLIILSVCDIISLCANFQLLSKLFFSFCFPCKNEVLLLFRSGKEFDITSQRVAASNPFLKEAFIEALQQSE